MLSVLLSASVQAQQAPGIDWDRSFGGTHGDWFNGVIETAAGELVFTGFSMSSDGDATINQGLRDLWVVKSNGLGQIVWQHSYGGSNYDEGSAISATADGGYIVAGITQSSDGHVLLNQGEEDVWVLKLDPEGDIQWQFTFGGPGNDGARSVIQTSDGGYLVAGYSSSIGGDVTTNQGGSDQWVIKLNSSGGIQWERSLGSIASDDTFDIIEVIDGGFVLVGNAHSGGDVSATNGGGDVWVVKLNLEGDILWEYSYGGTIQDSGKAIVQAADGGFMVIGSSQSSNGFVSVNYGINDVWLIKLDEDGIFQWDASYGGSVSDIGTSIIASLDGGYVISGYTFSTNGHITNNNGENDYWIIKVDGSGELLWQRTMGGAAIDNAHDLVETSDGGYVVVGLSSSDDGDISSSHGGVSTDAWVVKLEPDDILTTVAMHSSSDMMRVFPNPALHEVNITFLEPEDAKYPIDLIDMYGRVIGKHVYRAEYGSSRIIMDITELSPGMYSVRSHGNNGVSLGSFIKMD